MREKGVPPGGSVSIPLERLSPSPCRGVRNDALFAVGRSDPRTDLSYVPVAFGHGDGRRWGLELLGAPIDEEDRQFLSGRAGGVPLRGFRWSVRLTLGALVGPPRAAPYTSAISLRTLGSPSCRPVAKRECRPWVGRGHPSRSVLVSMLEPDTLTAAALREAGAVRTCSDRLVLLEDGAHVPAATTERLVIAWRPGWGYSPRWGALDGVLLEFDSPVNEEDGRARPRLAQVRTGSTHPGSPEKAGVAWDHRIPARRIPGGGAPSAPRVPALPH